MKIKWFSVLLCLGCALALTACQSNRQGGIVTGKYHDPSRDEGGEAVMGTELAEQDQTDEPGADAPGADLFLITNNDMESECLILEQMASGKQYMYSYSIGTSFLDKYGNRTNVSYFEPGRVIRVGKKDMRGRLLEAQISDQVWEYPDVTRFSVDEERSVFSIANTNYSFDDNLFVHSDGEMLAVSDLTEYDTLRVTGIGKKIYSVSVTTGHGQVRLENTELFDGSFIQIGRKIFAEITPNMTLEVPEGTYTVAVANNGYGGSEEITVERGAELVLDLDTLKGEGPKFGSILFAVDVEDAILQIDGKAVDYSEPVELQYGVHRLSVTADDYDTYSKKLFVNSSEATIVIAMSGEGNGSASGEKEDDEDGEDDDGTDSQTGSAGSMAGSMAGSLAGSGGSGSSGNTAGSGTSVGATSEAELDAIVGSLLDDDDDDDGKTSDYLSTLMEVLSALSDSSN